DFYFPHLVGHYASNNQRFYRPCALSRTGLRPSSKGVRIGAAFEEPEKHYYHHHDEQTRHYVFVAYREPNQKSDGKKRFQNNGLQKCQLDKLYIGQKRKPRKAGKMAE